MCEVRASVYGEDKVDGAERNVWGINCTRNFLDIAYMENETATKVGLQKQDFESK